MTSRMGVLFQEARNTVKIRIPTPEPDQVVVQPQWLAVGRIENFLTEMLSLAVLVDWRPMGELLAGIDVIDRSPPIACLGPYTRQQLVRGCDLTDRARLDLVLAVEGAGSDLSEVWVEVKAGAPFSGDQIERYLLAIREAEDGVSRRLAVLGQWHSVLEDCHDDGVEIQTHTWTELAEIAAQASPIWRELALFLAERGLINDPAQSGTEVLSVEWLADAIADALVPPVAWCDWHAGRDIHTTRRSVLAHLNKSERESGRRFVQRWAPGQLTRVELGAADEPDWVCLWNCEYGADLQRGQPLAQK